MSEGKVLIQMRDLRLGNGIAATIMNYYPYLMQSGYDVDFLLNRNIDSPHLDIVAQYGSNIYTLPNDTNKPNKQNYKYIKEVIANKYDIIHVNISGLNALEALFAAKQAQIPCRIYHAHNPKETSSLKARIRSTIYENPCVWLANHYIACSSIAGNSVFGDRTYTILKNTIDSQQFIYDEDARKQLRAELKIENKFVVGVVGRFAEQKNPFFTIDVFSEIVKLVPNAYLIWAGDGSLRQKIQTYTDQHGLHNCVHFLGNRNDVCKLYSAMDVFLLPSKFEGLGIVFLEAQVSGLPCFGSNIVPNDIEITSKMHRLSLTASPMQWASAITRAMNQKRYDQVGSIVKAGFDINSNDGALNKLYNSFSIKESQIV